MNIYRLPILILVLLLSACGVVPSDQNTRPTPAQVNANIPAPPIEQAVVGQTLYVPIYSHIYYGSKGKSINLNATLSVRNIDPNQSIVIKSVDYYNTEGKLIRHFLDKSLVIGPLATQEYIVDEADTSGGSGANFLVDWYATNPVAEPLVEAVMISTSASQGISFVSASRVIKTISPNKN